MVQKFCRRDRLAVVVVQFERRSRFALPKSAAGNPHLFELRDNARVDGLNLRRNVPGDQFLALGKLFLERASIFSGGYFVERSPFHEQPSVVSITSLATSCQPAYVRSLPCPSA